MEKGREDEDKGRKESRERVEVTRDAGKKKRKE